MTTSQYTASTITVGDAINGTRQVFAGSTVIGTITGTVGNYRASGTVGVFARLTEAVRALTA